MSESTERKRLPKPVGLYDGSCKFCVTTTDQLRNLDKDGVIDWRDLHDEKVQRQFPNIDWDRANEEIHLIHTDGRVRTGVNAVRDIAELIGGEAGRLVAQTMEVPGVHEAAEMVYKTISENRHRIMGRN